MIDTAQHRRALDENISSAQNLVRHTHLSATGSESDAEAISRDARGLAILLLFAAYERLLTSLTITLLETAVSLNVSNKRLQPGFQQLALASAVDAVRDTAASKKYTKILPNLLKAVDPGPRTCTIDPNTFPSNGTYMKRSQIEHWCSTFAIDDPSSILHRTWESIDAVVTWRNGIAHGRLTPGEVGRNYTEDEVSKLIADWRDDWSDFLANVQAAASSRDFFRVP